MDASLSAGNQEGGPAFPAAGMRNVAFASLMTTSSRITVTAP